MSSTKHRRADAALRHVIDALEAPSWSEAISERGIRLSVGAEYGALSVSPSSTIPDPSASQARCRYPEELRLQRVRNHMVCLRGDLLSIGLDFSDRFPDVLQKIANGESVSIVEYEPSLHQATDL